MDIPTGTTPIDNAALYDEALSAPQLRSYVRLLARAWDGHAAPSISLSFDRQLVPLLGVSRTQARQHLATLRAAGWIKWSTDGQGRLFIAFPRVIHSPPLRESGFPDGRSGTTPPIKEALRPPLPSGFPDSRAAATTSSQESNTPSYIESVVVVVESGKPVFRTADLAPLPPSETGHPPPVPSGKPDWIPPADYADRLHALHTAGIGEPTAGRLALMPHMEPAYVAAHAAKAKARRIDTGLLVHILRSADQAPEYCPECQRLDGDHHLSCDATRRRYVEGAYAEFIQH